MTGPETIYADLTSGDAGTIVALESDVGLASSDLREHIELIRFAADKPDWASPTARTRFNMRAWACRAASEIAYIRLNRAELTLQRVAGDYRAMDGAATGVIEQWRTQKQTFDNAIMLLLFRAGIMLALGRVGSDYGDRLTLAQDFLEADPLTTDQEDWLENGLVRTMRRDLEHPGVLGPIIPDTLATGNDDGGWAPQGLGYDPKTGLLIQTSYDGDDARLHLVDPDTGELVRTVDLGPDANGNQLPPNHAGGVAVRDGTVWVTSSENPPRVYPYSMDSITGSRPGDAVPVQYPPQEVSAGAYSTIVGDTMYVGSFEHSAGNLYTYTYDPRTGAWGDEQGPFPTPPETQGISVRDGEVVFSTSHGRENDGSLQSYHLNDVLSGGQLGDPIRTVDLPNMAEGVAALPDGLMTTYESGSASYVDPRDNPLEALWASMHMTVTPYSDLGLPGGGFDVEPPTLKDASRLFGEAETGLDGVAGQIAALSLPPYSLGDVPQAGGFAAAVTTHFDTTSTWLDEGRLSANITASGLVASAEGYDDSDNDSGGMFGRLKDLIS